MSTIEFHPSVHEHDEELTKKNQRNLNKSYSGSKWEKKTNTIKLPTRAINRRRHVNSRLHKNQTRKQASSPSKGGKSTTNSTHKVKNKLCNKFERKRKKKDRFSARTEADGLSENLSKIQGFDRIDLLCNPPHLSHSLNFEQKRARTDVILGL